MDITKARENLINSQVRTWHGLNYKVNNALIGVPREFFAPNIYKKFAFSDMQIPINKDYSMFEPKIEGRLLSALDIKEDEYVLEIGTGTGYLTACIAQLAKYVSTVEIDKNLAEQAQYKFDKLNIDNIELIVGDASKTWQSDKFYDVVVVGCAVPKIIGRYFHLLNLGGRIFVIEGSGIIMNAMLITRVDENKWKKEILFETKIATLKGVSSLTKFSF